MLSADLRSCVLPTSKTIKGFQDIIRRVRQQQWWFTVLEVIVSQLGRKFSGCLKAKQR